MTARTITIAATLFVACAVTSHRPPRPPPDVPGTRVVVVDDRFDPEERHAIEASARAWERTCPALRLRLVAPSDAWPWPAPYALRVEAVRGSLEDCGDIPPGSRALGCFVAPDRVLLRVGWSGTALPAHELGHALGLPHASGPSVMRADLSEAAPEPTAADGERLRAFYPCAR